MSPVTEHSAEGQREVADPGSRLCPAGSAQEVEAPVLGIRAVSGARACPLGAWSPGRHSPALDSSLAGDQGWRPILVQDPQAWEGPWVYRTPWKTVPKGAEPSLSQAKQLWRNTGRVVGPRTQRESPAHSPP